MSYFIQRLFIPSSGDPDGLYVRVNGKAFPNNLERGLCFKEKDILDFNSYFNSFYLKNFVSKTDVKTFFYDLIIDGSVDMKIYAEDVNGDKRILKKALWTGGDKRQKYRLDFSDVVCQARKSRIYLSLQAKSDKVIFYDGFLGSYDIPRNEVRLAVIICHFKKEAFVKNTIKKVLQDTELCKKDFELFIVDNGKTLKEKEFKDRRLHLIMNRNVGGSGGFSRGLVEAFERERFTHFVCMDDDIEIQSESLFRLMTFYEYARYDVAVAGAMFDLDHKMRLYERGALYCRKYNGWTAFGCTPLDRDLNVASPKSLNRVLIEKEIDYGGFWFFAFSRDVVNRIGVLMPYFKKGDDMDFGLRVTRYAKRKIIALPGIGVWHHSFAKIDPPLDQYFYLRNNIINQVLHFQINYFKMTIMVTLFLLFRWRLGPKILDLSLLAVQDFLKGPKFLIYTKAEDILKEISLFNRNYPEMGALRSFGKYINGWIYWSWIVLTSYQRWKRAKREWKESAMYLRSITFWKEYLREESTRK